MTLSSESEPAQLLRTTESSCSLTHPRVIKKGESLLASTPSPPPPLGTCSRRYKAPLVLHYSTFCSPAATPCSPPSCSLLAACCPPQWGSGNLAASHCLVDLEVLRPRSPLLALVSPFMELVVELVELVVLPGPTSASICPVVLAAVGLAASTSQPMRRPP